jgi:arylsulfatase A-like enzyme
VLAARGYRHPPLDAAVANLENLGCFKVRLRGKRPWRAFPTASQSRSSGRGQPELITKNMPTLGASLRHAGCATGTSGTWHNRSKVGTCRCDRGFAESYGLRDSGSHFFRRKNPDPALKGDRVGSFGHNAKALELEDFPAGYSTTNAFTERVIETIKIPAAPGKPFFHYLLGAAPPLD